MAMHLLHRAMLPPKLPSPVVPGNHLPLDFRVKGGGGCGPTLLAGETTTATTTSTTSRPKGWRGNACAGRHPINVSIGPSPPLGRKPRRFPWRISGGGGCDFPARPSLSALAQAVFWSPVAVPSVLTIAAVPDHLPATSTPAVPDLEAAREGPEGVYAFCPADDPIQLLFLPGSDRRALVALVPIDLDLLDRIDALTRFWRILHGRRPLADTRLTRQQRRRLRLMLQAVDGHMRGATYREIAIAIYGETRVAADPWKTSPLRDSVIGLVGGGLAMVAGGYLNLLRHRRRS